MKNYGNIIDAKDIITKEYLDNALSSSASVFDFYNWTELKGTTYDEYSKNSNGEYISTISNTQNNKLIAKRTEWQSVVNNVTHYYTKIEVFDSDGSTIKKVSTKDEYKKDGTYKSTIT